MSSVFKVTVLCPSGHRVTVKLDSREAPVLDILRHVCKKRDLDLNTHRLKHHNTVLDNTISIRYANLPQNANLELIETEGPANPVDKPVKVAVQIEGVAGRSVLEVADDATSLADVVARAGCPPPADSDEAVLIYMRREVTDLEGTTLRDLGIVAGGAAAALRVVFRKPGGPKDQAHVKPAAAVQPAAAAAAATKKPEAVWRPMKAEPDMTLSKIVGETKSNDDEMMADQNSGKGIISTEQKAEASKTPQHVGKGNKTGEKEQVVKEEEAVFVKPKEPAVLHYLEGGEGGGNFLAYDRGEAGATAALSHLSDDFFEMTLDDVKLLHREARELAKDLDAGGQLMTQGMRETQKEGQKLNLMNKYKKCLVRMNFAQDAVVIQGVFTPVQTVGQVAASLRPFLRDPEAVTITLYTTPPKTVLDPASTLLEANCVPSVLLHVDVAGAGKVLKPDLPLSNASGVEQAVRDSGVIRTKSTPGPTLTSSATSSSTTTGVKRPSESELKKLPDDKKLPKWLSKGKQ